MPDSSASYDFITTKIKSLKDVYPSLRPKNNDYVFSALAVKSMFYKNPSYELTEPDISDIIVDGQYDGGADFLLADPNSETSDLVIGQSKYYASIRNEDVINACIKMIDFFKNTRSGNFDGINQRVQGRFFTLYSDVGTESKIIFVFCTSAPQNGINRDQIKRKLKNHFPDDVACEIRILFGQQLEEEIKESESRRPTVETGKLTIDHAGNCLTFNGGSAAIVNVSAYSLKMLYAQHSINLLSRNLRYHISGGDVDKCIRDTIKDCPESFWQKNNGITIICDDYDVDGRELKLKNFSIVNGGQTTYQIHKSAVSENSDFYLTCKVITVAGETEDDKNAFSLEIAKAANMQKAIKPSDLKANAPEQVRFAQSMREAGIFYLTKRGESIPSDYKDAYRHTNLSQIGKLCLSGIFQSPAASRNKPSILYIPKYYDPVFNGNQGKIANLCKELLYIDYYYSVFLKAFDKEYEDTPNSNDILSFAHNARTICTAFVAFVSRVYQGNISTDELSRIFSLPVLNGADDSTVYDICKNLDGISCFLPVTLFENKDHYDAVLNDLFNIIIKAGVINFKFELQHDSSLSASNYLKKDRNYYGVLSTHWDSIYPAAKTIMDGIFNAANS